MATSSWSDTDNVSKVTADFFPAVDASGLVAGEAVLSNMSSFSPGGICDRFIFAVTPMDAANPSDNWQKANFVNMSGISRDQLDEMLSPESCHFITSVVVANLLKALVEHAKTEQWDEDMPLGNKDEEIRTWFLKDEPDCPTHELAKVKVSKRSYLEGSPASSSNLRAPGTFFCYMGPDFRDVQDGGAFSRTCAAMVKDAAKLPPAAELDAACSVWIQSCLRKAQTTPAAAVSASVQTAAPVTFGFVQAPTAVGGSPSQVTTIDMTVGTSVSTVGTVRSNTHPRVRMMRERLRQRQVAYQAGIDEHNHSALVFDATVGPLFGSMAVASSAAANAVKLTHAKRKHEAAERACKTARQAERAASVALTRATTASVTSDRAAKASRRSFDNAILAVRDSMVSPHPRGRPA
jgi:hypothetical protein